MVHGLYQSRVTCIDGSLFDRKRNKVSDGGAAVLFNGWLNYKSMAPLGKIYRRLLALQEERMKKDKRSYGCFPWSALT